VSALERLTEPLKPSQPPPLRAFDPEHSALLLDFDGTLVEIAALPQDVRVPASLKHVLARLRDRLGGALCIVSGRAIGDLDAFLAPLRLAIVGGHGAEVRLTPAGEIVEAPAGLAPDLRRRLLTIAADTPGLLAEEKRHSLALHYRLVPEQERQVKAAIDQACADWPADAVEVLPGKAVFEVKPRAFNKGAAIRNLMLHAPFRRRRPIFIGDDVTDESALAALPEFNGAGFSVGRRLNGAAGMFATPREVRHWLYGLIYEREATEPAAR
jgi:trehalose 6-phosphate phosphatase